MSVSVIVALWVVSAAGGAPPPKASPPKTKAEPAPAASTDPNAKAKELFAWAQKLYAQARYADAIAKFEEAYLLRPHPVIHYNIGKCWEQLGETAKALRQYRDYLRLSPDAADKETVSDAIANLERRLKEKGVQQLMVFAEPPNASIEVDGKVLGGSPASIELTAGNHLITVKREGFEPVERSFVMSTVRATEMTITLRPKATDAPKDTATAAPAKTEPTVVAAPPAPKKSGRRFTWVAAGAGALGLGGGMTLGLLSRSASSELKADLSMPRDKAANEQLVTRIQTFSLGANIAYAVAGAALIAAVVLFFLEG